METDQDQFWAGEFGNAYSDRNNTRFNLASKTALFARILRLTRNVKSVRELGANVGLNIRALQALIPDGRFQAVEINKYAYRELSAIPGIKTVCGSLLNAMNEASVDLSFTCGVLIHISPDRLRDAYARLYEASNRYVLICEYYNPQPVEVYYRGHTKRLFKRDFAKEILTEYTDLALVDYGFVYNGDPTFPDDDLTWFLMEKIGHHSR